MPVTQVFAPPTFKSSGIAQRNRYDEFESPWITCCSYFIFLLSIHLYFAEVEEISPRFGTEKLVVFMSWLYTRSSTWRFIVNLTKKSPAYMAVFAVIAMGVPAYLGEQVMQVTNGPKIDTALEQELRKKSSLESRMLAKAQKERLQVLFDELKEGKEDNRYRAALEYVVMASVMNAYVY